MAIKLKGHGGGKGPRVLAGEGTAEVTLIGTREKGEIWEICQAQCGTYGCGGFRGHPRGWQPGGLRIPCLKQELGTEMRALSAAMRN